MIGPNGVDLILAVKFELYVAFGSGDLDVQLEWVKMENRFGS
jgi:hypothetical protein